MKFNDLKRILMHWGIFNNQSSIILAMPAIKKYSYGLIQTQWLNQKGINNSPFRIK